MNSSHLCDGDQPQGGIHQKLARDLDITQESAWYMNLWIRDVFKEDNLGKQLGDSGGG